MFRGTFSIALISVLVLELAAPAAFGCGPFDFQIIDGPPVTRDSEVRSRSVGGAAPLAWAREVARDARTIHSDAGFFRNPDGTSWDLGKDDSGLSKANTLLEFYGYFLKLLGGEDPSPKIVDMLNNKVLGEASLQAFEGISINMLRSYPKQTENMLGIAVAIAKVFGSEGKKVLEQMERQNHNRAEHGVKFWTRPAYLDSKASPGVAAPCMAIAYGQDYFTNTHIAEDLAEINKTQSPPMTETDYREKYLKGAFGIALQSSLVDHAAAQAMKQLDPETGKLASTSFKVGGKVECSLVPSKTHSLSLIRTRCGRGPDMRFYQTNPVVREVDEGMQRMVQVGMDLYRVECKDSSGASVPVSSSRVTWEETETLFKDLMQLGSGEGTPDSVARDVGAAAAVLTSLPLSDAAFNAAKEKVVKASKTCAEYLNAGKTGTINGKPGDAGSARPGS